MSSTLPRMTGQERRRAILDAAIRLFSERGFRGVTTRELAHTVGVTEPVLYQHFPSKRDLYTAIIEHKIAQTEELKGRLEDLCLTPLSPDEFFFQLAMLAIEWHGTDPSFIRLMMYAQLDGHEMASLFHERMIDDYFRLVVDAIARMNGGRIAQVISPEIAAYGFLSMIHNLCQDRLFHSTPSGVRVDSEQAIRTLVDIYLHGLTAQAGAKESQ